MTIKFILMMLVIAFCLEVQAKENSFKQLYRLSDIQSAYLENNDTINIAKIPVWSLDSGNGWNLFVRSSSYIPTANIGSEHPSVNTASQLMTLFSPDSSATFKWGAGSVLLHSSEINTSLNDDHWQIGPAAAFVISPGKWVLGSTVSNVWSFSDDRQDELNQFNWQYLVNYKMQKGWYLTSAPMITANWNAHNGNQWTIPLGGGLGKVFRIGNQTFDGNVSAYYNIAKPEEADDWQLRMQFRYLLPE
jgi:hypothetical protein